MSATPPTLLFCVGAAKAGTSWLHRALSDHPECHLRSIKELHYFDALDHGEVDRQIAAVEAARTRYLAEIDGAGPHRRANRLRQAADCDAWLDVLRRDGEDRAAYLGYLADGAEGRLVADMTPAYSLLSEARLRAMAGIAPDVRFVYLIRDPVERLWSHVRMIAARRAGPDEDLAGRAGRILSRALKGKEHQIAIRSDYAGAMTRLARAVDPRRLLVMVYEEMFSPEAFARVCAFLGIGAGAAEFATRVHESPDLALLPDARARAREWLAAQYDFVADWLGREPAGWHYEPLRV